MRRFATSLLLAALLVCAPEALAQDTRTHDTGSASLRIFNDGYFGADVGAPTDTTFNFGGFAPLYEGQLIVAVGPAQVSGEPYATTNELGQEWLAGTGPLAITAPAPFTTAYEATYTDNGAVNPNPAGLSVRQRTYSRTGDDFVVVEVQITNTTASPRTGVYIGMFADFDVSPTAVLDVGGFDAMTQSVWSRSTATTGNTNVYGVTLLGMAASGWTVDALPGDGVLYGGLTQAGTPGTVAADRRNLIGAGPFSLAAGGNQTVRFAYVAGTDMADFQANAAAARALFPVAVTNAVINTGTVTTTVYTNGNIGGDCSGSMAAFQFGSDEGMCGAGFLMGFSPTNVVGDGYIIDTTTEWTPLGPITASTSFPYTGLNQGSKAVFANAENNVHVEMNAYYGGANTDFVVFRYDITNTGTTPLAVGYPGIFADWDVGGGAYATNLAAVNPATATMYAWDPTGASANYFGVSSLRTPLSGWRYDMPYPPAAGQQQDEAAFFAGLTIPGALMDNATFNDQRHVLGTGPFTVAAGARRTVDFAFVAGASLADFQSNVQAARGFVVSNENPAPDVVETALSTARPNPTAGTTELSLTVEQSQAVRVAVYDALGREVAVLFDAPVSAGVAQTLRLDGRALPAGLYVVRATGDTFSATQRVVITR